MLTQTFQHDGATYTLRQPSIFDDEMQSAAWIDLCRAIAKAHGLDFDTLPIVLQRLSRKYVNWMQVTAISNTPDYAKASVYSADVTAFEQWKTAILANGQTLAIVWDTAYNTLTQAVADEKKANGDSSSGLVFEPLPPVAIVEPS
jgi:hypothetical protein